MRKISNVLVWIGAAGVCALMTYITLDAGFTAVASNLTFLFVMIAIIIVAIIFGFRRMDQTVDGLNNAQRKLVSVYKNRNELVDITKPGAVIFQVDYLDRKYQEYLGYLRKTNSPCDIGDYIGEYEINNYTHRRLVELVPDILTSLGILGTFMGLVWGLRGFNPVSYEAMASSITSLIDGIKVAFITSIYGIVLSLAFTYTLRGKLTGMSESLDGFIDKYYLCAVTPTDATAMNHILANQHEQTDAIRSISTDAGVQMAAAVTDHMDPVMNDISSSIRELTDVMTVNQQKMLNNVAEKVSSAMRKEYVSEFAEMRSLLTQTNTAEKQYLESIRKSQDQFKESMQAGSEALSQAIVRTTAQDHQMTATLMEQQKHLTEFADYMTQAMSNMNAISEVNAKASEALNRQVEALNRLVEQTLDNAASAKKEADRAAGEANRADVAADRAEEPVQRTKIDDIDELTTRLDEMIRLLEKQNNQITQQSRKKRGLFG